MFQYTYSTKAIITFDEYFQVEFNGSLDKMVNTIEWACDKYGFTKADAVDKETGELLIVYADVD